MSRASELLELFALELAKQKPWPIPEFIAGVALDDRRLISLFRSPDWDPIVGFEWAVDDLIGSGRPQPPLSHVAAVMADEVAEPRRDGFLLDVVWAHKLVTDPDSIVWLAAERAEIDAHYRGTVSQSRMVDDG